MKHLPTFSHPEPAGVRPSLEDLLQGSSRAIVLGVGGGGDVVGAFVAARLLQEHGIEVTLGGLAWENPTVDPVPGPRTLQEVSNVRPIHQYVWEANPDTRTIHGAVFAESRMAGITGSDILLIDINGGVKGVVEGLRATLSLYDADLLVGVDVGGDSLAQGHEPGLRSPLADSIMLAAFAELDAAGTRTLWAFWGYGSDAELTEAELEGALSTLAATGGLLGAWGLTSRLVTELERIVREIPTEASAIPVECAHGATGLKTIRQGSATVRLSPLPTLTFFLSATILFRELSRPARAVRNSGCLDEANEALHAIGLRTELDFEREFGSSSVSRSP